jgi:hypothetical protein
MSRAEKVRQPPPGVPGAGFYGFCSDVGKRLSDFCLASVVVVVPVILKPPVIILRLLMSLGPLMLFLLPLFSLPLIPLLLLPLLIPLGLHPLLVPLSGIYGTSADLNPPESKRSGKGRDDKYDDKKQLFHIGLL